MERSILPLHQNWSVLPSWFFCEPYIFQILSENKKEEGVYILIYVCLIYTVQVHTYPFPQNSPTDLRHFDPTMTCIPPTLSDLVTTDRALHLEGYDYVAPEGDFVSSLEMTAEEHMVLEQQSGNNEDPCSLELSQMNSSIQDSVTQCHSSDHRSVNNSVIEVIAEVNES